jgi:hypothetical protein
MYSRLLRWLSVTRRGIGGKIDREQQSEFFTWFNLIRSSEPERQDHAGTWQSFQPSGPAFQHLVRLELLIDARRDLLAAELWVARTFIGDPRNASFARDITSSFLRWALVDIENRSADGLIANIADMRGAGVIMHAPVSAPLQPDLTGGYRVYLGMQATASLEVENGLTVLLANVTDGNHSDWLSVRVSRPQP